MRTNPWLVLPFALALSACTQDATTDTTPSSGKKGPLRITSDTLMAVHACLATECLQGPTKHRTYLLQSADAGETWGLVPGWTAYDGSVPDLIRRNGKIYLYNPQKVRVIDVAAGTMTEASTVSITESNGTAVQFVDPSPILNSDGRIVLHYLISTGIKGNPAGCATYPCTKKFGSAVEVQGSEGTQFVADSETRVSVSINSNADAAGPVASDPDIFTHPGGYVLYLSRGISVQVFVGASLAGSFSDPSSGALTLSHVGGVPAGHFDGTNYWAMTNKGRSSNPMANVIRRAKASSLAGLTSATFSDWITSETLGLSSDYSVESPGFLSAAEAPAFSR